MTRRSKVLRNAAFLILASATASLAEPAPAAQVSATPAAQSQQQAIAARDAAAAYIVAVAKGEWTRAYAMLADGVRAKVSLTQFIKGGEPLSHAGLKSVTFGKANMSTPDDGLHTAEFDGVIISLGAGTIDVLSKLIYTTGGWKVEHFKFKSRPGTVPKSLEPAAK